LTPHRESAHGLAWRPDGKEIWYTAADHASARALRAVSLSGDDRVVARMPGSLTLHDLGPRGTVLLARDEERFGIVGRPPGAGEERDLSWFDESGVGDLSADGRVLFFGDRNGVYLRRMDGSPAVRLGDGFADALSPDGRWALTTSPDARQLALLPTGPGVPRTLAPHTIASYEGALWFPDGKRVLFNGIEAGRELRVYVQDLEGGAPRPVTPEGVWAQALSPDGTLVAATGAGRAVLLQPLDGGPGRTVPGSEPEDVATGWTEDRRKLWVYRRGQVPAPVFRLDLATGRRELWKRLIPADAAGVVSISGFRVTADGASYAFTFRRVRSDLYLAEGLR
jgi:dipeptidyl aminopeptidase/acylaminoacyl peptidase